MKRVEWNDAPYAVGVSQGVFYPSVGIGIPWDGLVDVSSTPDGGDFGNVYNDGKKLFVDVSSENFMATIRSVTCPDSFFDDVLLQDRITRFGFCYREDTHNGHLVHLIYNVNVIPETLTYQHGVIAPISFRIQTKPVDVPGFKPSSHLVVDTGKASVESISALEDILYGSSTTDARLPLPSEVVTLFANNKNFWVIDNGDGTFTATSTNGNIVMLDSTTFQITTDSAVWVDTNTYTLYSF